MTDPWRPLQNRALAGQYPPASVYKVFVALAALEDEVIEANEKIYCPGFFKKWGRSYRCWKRAGHGAVDLRDAIKQSCDVWFYEMGLRLGVDRIAHFARAFQLGSTSGFPFGDEKPGLIPTRAWKARRFGEAWQKGETVSIAIGQGFDLTTPIQLAVAYAAIANGGVLLEPRIVQKTVGADGVSEVAGSPVVRGHVPVSPESMARIRDALEAVVGESRGTASLARVPGVRVAGKTGTAQVVRLKYTEDLEPGEIPIKHRDHAWFVGFAPADSAKIVVVALVEHGGGGGAVAAPLAQRVFAAYFEKESARNREALAAVEVHDAER
jgi:penicillin-binding protein 2